MICKRCKIDKDLNDYHNIKDIKKINWCKDCTNQYKRDNYKNKSSLLKKWNNAKYNYDIDYNKFIKIMCVNNCAICNYKFKDDKEKCIDHNHTTNKIREVLCNDCNTSLGKLKEDIDTLQSMINYIKKHNQ